MKQKTASGGNRRERGQTILLVAVSLVSLLAMAALAIDVVTLYAARSEIQRTADAAALAGAKAVADSGVTTLPPGDPNLLNAVALARAMAASAINAMETANPAINQVAGQPITWSHTVTFPATANPTNSNPHVTVTLQVTTLPTFFARIWGNRTATVNASATAEAYNPANVQSFTPIAPKGVKPWLVANVDPNNSGAPFIDRATGVIETNLGANVIGETLNLTADCVAPGPGCTLLTGGNPPGVGPWSTGGYPQVEYVPAAVTPDAGSNVCPSACTGASPYEQSIECADMTTSYKVLSCGGGTASANWDSLVYPGGVGGLSDLGTECLIHATGTGNNKGQDTLDPSPWPFNPMQITAGAGNPPQNGYVVTTSNSIVTIPVIDPTTFQAVSPFQVTVVGFLQAFVNEVHGSGNPHHAGDIKVTVLNIAGCGNSPTTASPVVGGSGTSPVPVRLITPP
ncbi:MAG TPA: pilus assembly protein TadG-related protein [Terriglobales bacterium]|nr:pilus assembly protein TadG-related protein [Terriglobales bacterium]